jgi:glycosyltransferase involved in cell wall biosynthesis
MRIVQVVEHLGVGGLEKMAVELAIAQKSAGHDPFIYCVSEPGALAAQAVAAGVPVIPFHKPPGFSPRAILAMARRMRTDRPDAVHTHNWIIHHYGAAAAALARVRAVVNTQHGLETVSPRQTRLFRSVLPATDAVVFVAEEARRVFQDAIRLPAAKARVIRNGIPVGRFMAKAASPGARRPHIRFGTVGRIVPIKDHATLLRAFALLRDRLPGCSLRIVGYGALQPQIENLARELELGDRFAILPPDSDIPSFLLELDLFVLSSWSEGLPVCVLEAMAAGVPIISTRVGGIPEVAAEGQIAWYCPPHNPEMLAVTMYNAANSADLSARGGRARLSAETSFSIESTFAAYEKLFLELLGRHG